MRTFVQQKPLKRFRRKQSDSLYTQKIKSTFKIFSLRFLRVFFVIIGCIYLIFFAFKKTTFSPEYLIKKINYNTADTKIYDDPYLYKEITNLIKKENYYITRLNKASILSQLQEKYPMIADLDITYAQENTANVRISFYKPHLVIRNQEKRFGVLSGYIFPLYSGNQIGKDVLRIDMPLYASGLTNLSGLFFKIPFPEFFSQMQMIHELLPDAESIVYLPGGERTVVFIPKGKRLYINNLGDIPNQIKNYQLLKKYYPDYAFLKEIDLGSLEKEKVIIRKW